MSRDINSCGNVTDNMVIVAGVKFKISRQNQILKRSHSSVSSSIMYLPGVTSTSRYPINVSNNHAHIATVGGKSPSIIFNDADLDNALAMNAQGFLVNSGQVSGLVMHPNALVNAWP